MEDMGISLISDPQASEAAGKFVTLVVKARARLNYAILEKKIDRILANNHEVRLEELGVSEKFRREYLKLYLRSHSGKTSLEEVGDSLRRLK